MDRARPTPAGEIPHGFTWIRTISVIGSGLIMYGESVRIPRGDHPAACNVVR